LARCAAPAEKKARPSVGERQAAVATYSGVAIGLLRRAASNGFRNAADLRGDPDLSRLRDTEPFRQILAEIERSPTK
jgi:hypothetical protein